MGCTGVGDVRATLTIGESAIAAIDHVLKLPDTVTTAGQPTEAQFAAIKPTDHHIVVILALLNSTNAIPHERAIVEAQSMVYVHLPVMWTHDKQHVFVHCAMNMRVLVFMYLYRWLCEGMDKMIAAQAWHQIWVPNDRWQSFMTQVVEYYQQH